MLSGTFRAMMYDMLKWHMHATTESDRYLGNVGTTTLAVDSSGNITNQVSFNIGW